jgi:L-threonylcarbamoyladenylate synthase
MRVIRAAERSESDLQREVAACIRAGGTLIFPTETVYGVGCDPDNDTAIDAIFALKARSASKPLALHVADREQAAPFCAALTQCARDAMERLWPGPVAIVVQRRADRYARAAGGFATISLRCPDHDVCRSLLRATGPLAATSANISGRPPYTGDSDDLSGLPQATLAILAGLTPLRRESSIVDCTGDTPVVLREGAVPVAVIREKLGTPIPLR